MRGFAVNAFAEKLRIRPDQLSALLNTELKASFADLVNSARVREAARLLKNAPDMNVLDIAYETGINSRGAFNRAFKRVMRMGPTEYRKAQASSGRV